ncbi:MAG: heavy metal translocating P-type ATPase [Candidatus Sericytochromatia bacterium]|nr:heavy metal translocating P-type ATPase [Candidatus Sericytochromatia bacterium]
MQAVAIAASCVHCGLAAPAPEPGALAFCCAGCRLAYGILNGAPIPDVPPPPFPYDDTGFLQDLGGGTGPTYVLTFRLEGLHCPSCVRVVETVCQRPGVSEARVHLTAGKLALGWQQDVTPLSTIAARLAGAGYSLVPIVASALMQARRLERRAWALRLAVTGFAAVSVGFLGESLTWGRFGADDAVSWSLLGWISALVATPTLFYAGMPFLQGAWRGLRHRILGMDLTIALGALATYIASMVSLFRGHGALYFDSLTMFLFLIVVGRWGETWAQEKAAAAADALLPPPLANVMARTDDGWVARPPYRIVPGDRVRFGAGDICAVDGCILSGTAEIDDALLTGESRPQLRTVGDRVHGGSRLVEGELEIVVTTVGATTTLARLRRLAGQASATKGPWSDLAERTAHWLVLMVIAAAAFTLWLWRHEPDQALLHAVSVLIISCPCALGLATPAALSLASARSWRQGLLIKNGHALDALGNLTHLMLDKTGTVTTHTLCIVTVLPHAAGLPGIPPAAQADAVLRCAAALTVPSAHPVARAITAGVSGLVPAVTDWRNVPGSGVIARLEGRRIIVGRAAWLQSQQVTLPADLLAEAEKAAQAGHTVTWVAAGGTCLGAIVLGPAVRPDAAETVRRLQQLGIVVTLLSGDSQSATAVMANRIGTATGQGGIRPEGKLSVIEQRKGPGKVIGMVGDGVNDGPALAAADVGIAIGEGSGLAIESAPVVLLGERLMPLVDGVLLARRTGTVIRQNLALSALYNLIAVPLAMAGLVTPAMAAVLMPISSLLVVGNALRLAHWRLPWQSSS